MADKSVRLEVRGLRELHGAFKQMENGMDSALKDEFLPIARAVASSAAAKVPSRSGRAASSITPKATNRGASVAFGGSRAPYFPWLDFGGSTGRGHQPGRAWSGAIKREWRGVPVGKGRYVYPTISEHREDIREAVDDAIERLATKAGFETKGGV